MPAFSGAKPKKGLSKLELIAKGDTRVILDDEAIKEIRESIGRGEKINQKVRRLVDEEYAKLEKAATSQEEPSKLGTWQSGNKNIHLQDAAELLKIMQSSLSLPKYHKLDSVQNLLTKTLSIRGILLFFLDIRAFETSKYQKAAQDALAEFEKFKALMKNFSLKDLRDKHYELAKHEISAFKTMMNSGDIRKGLNFSIFNDLVKYQKDLIKPLDSMSELLGIKQNNRSTENLIEKLETIKQNKSALNEDLNKKLSEFFEFLNGIALYKNIDSDSVHNELPKYQDGDLIYTSSPPGITETIRELPYEIQIEIVSGLIIDYLKRCPDMVPEWPLYSLGQFSVHKDEDSTYVSRDDVRISLFTKDEVHSSQQQIKRERALIAEFEEFLKLLRVFCMSPKAQILAKQYAEKSTQETTNQYDIWTNIEAYKASVAEKWIKAKNSIA